MSTSNSIDLGGLSKQYAARDLPSHQKLKYRDIGQAGPEEVRKDKKDLRRELEERERLSSNKEKDSKRLSLTDSRDSEKNKKLKLDEKLIPVNLDADEVLPDSDDDDEDKTKKKSQSDNEGSEESEQDEDDDEDDDEDEDDDTEALMAELNRIKQERAAEAARLEEERKVREEKIRVENILKGNPLLNSTKSANIDFKVKRRWDDDVVFKNCAKMDSDNIRKKDFINDTLRSEFHKKFMERYIK